MLYIIYMVYIIYEMSPMALLFFDCFSCFYSPYDYCALRFTIQKVTFMSLRCDGMEMFKKNWQIAHLIVTLTFGLSYSRSEKSKFFCFFARLIVTLQHEHI